MSYQDIGDILEVHYTTVSTWYAKYKKEGIAGIKIQTRGRKEGAKRDLTPEQEIK